MAFVEELPSAQDIKDFDLPFGPDLEKPIEHRRTWLADRERDVYLTGVGLVGHPPFDEDYRQGAGIYLGHKYFDVILGPREGSLSDQEAPYLIHYPTLLKIMVYISPERGMIDVLPEVRKAPDTPHPFLQNKSFNEFVALLKEALSMYKAGQVGNKYIHGTITVSFGF